MLVVVRNDCATSGGQYNGITEYWISGEFACALLKGVKKRSDKAGWAMKIDLENKVLLRRKRRHMLEKA